MSNPAQRQRAYLAVVHEQLSKAEAERDAALSAMWGMICCASELRESVRKFAYFDGGKETGYGMER